MWKRCPVDGTRFFDATADYPLGRPPGNRFCCPGCETTARLALITASGGFAPASPKRARFYIPRVDGTQGTFSEQVNGGPPVDRDGNLITTEADFREGSRFKQGTEVHGATPGPRGVALKDALS